MPHYVDLVNRTTKNLIGTWDGRRHVIPPGKSSFPEAMAVKFKEQNPQMGSLDPYSMDRDYLLGIPDLGDPIDPIEVSGAVELLDRKRMDPIAATATEMKTSVGRLYREESSRPLTQPGSPIDSSFTKA